MHLALIHRALGSGVAPAYSIVWRTCLREIHFLDSGFVQDEAVLTGADAYALLLEVVCGLRSPIIGETEVQAQFKQFLTSEPLATSPELGRLGQRVLGDAKRIRHRYLQGFGAHSYGQLTARHIMGDRLAVIGTGALACEVVMSAPEQLPTDVWGRSSRRPVPPRPRDFTFTPFAEASGTSSGRLEPTTLVIAAPIGSDDLGTITSCYKRILNVVDLRSLDQITPVPLDVPVVLLGELLAEAARTDRGGARQVRAARADVRRLAELFANLRSLPRSAGPIAGWRDVCA